MKREAMDLMNKGQWQELEAMVEASPDDYTEDELSAIRDGYIAYLGEHEMDADELNAVTGGAAMSAGNGSGSVVGNIHYWCTTISQNEKCVNGALQSKNCWFSDGCTFVYHYYPFNKWIGGLSTDYPDRL